MFRFKWMGLILVILTVAVSGAVVFFVLRDGVTVLNYVNRAGYAFYQKEWTAQSGYYLIFRKLGHFTVYFVAACVVYGLVRRFRREEGSPMVLTLLIVLLLGSLDELIQAYLPTRTSAVQDVFVDFAGAVSAMVMVRLWQLISERGRKSVRGEVHGVARGKVERGRRAYGAVERVEPGQVPGARPSRVQTYRRRQWF